MVEAGALEVSEDTVADALSFGHEQVKRIIAAIRQLHDQLKPKKVVVPPLPFDEELAKRDRADAMARGCTTPWTPRSIPRRKATAASTKMQERDPGRASRKRTRNATSWPSRAFERLAREVSSATTSCITTAVPMGAPSTRFAQITCEVGLLPRVHGSALFTRGETQALATLTLGTKEDMQRLDLLFEDEAFKRFMLHYNFPPFSVGEVKFLRGPGRREIGHGALAERALMNLLPPEADFPYAMRLVSDILESNGSSSMATVCGGSLALMDAGVPLRSACAGIAMGLVIEGENAAVLTDIAGAEDHYGDMDFKVAGTRAGITALQMDIKVGGVSVAADAAGARTGPQGAHRDPRHHGPHAHRASRGRCRSTRRACSCSPFPPTRFAT